MASKNHQITVGVEGGRIIYSGCPCSRVFASPGDTVQWVFGGLLRIHFVGVSPLAQILPAQLPNSLTATVAQVPPGSYKYFIAIYFEDSEGGRQLLMDDPDIIVNPGGGTGK